MHSSVHDGREVLLTQGRLQQQREQTVCSLPHSILMICLRWCRHWLCATAVTPADQLWDGTMAIECPAAVYWLSHSSIFVFTAIFAPKKEKKRKFGYLFRPKNKKRAFSGTEKENEIRSASNSDGWRNFMNLILTKLNNFYSCTGNAVTHYFTWKAM